MSRSVDPDHFFQTSDSIAANKARAAKSKNKHGDPVDLKVKILAAHAWTDDSVLLACADGRVRLVDLKSKEVTKTFSSPQITAPLTCLAVRRGADPVVYAGCWDKNIYAWQISTRKPLPNFRGHQDFVKSLALASVDGQDVLISGSADCSIIVWNIEKRARLHQIKVHMRAVLSLAVDGSTLFSADSVRDIHEWNLSSDGVQQKSTEPIVVHETSVNKIHIVTDDSSDRELWTASSDKTVKRLVHREEWEADTTLEHPDFVKDVLILPGPSNFVVTACRDGDVRMWDAASEKLICRYEGHYDEVTGLVAVKDGRIMSVSLDGTVRQWGTDVASIESAKKPIASEEEEEEEEKEEPSKSGMTAEEEAELAELMDSD